MVEARPPQTVAAAVIEQATEFLLNGDLLKARSTAEWLAAGSPDNAELAHLLGLLDVRENRLNHAAQHLQKAVELSPDRPAWWRNLGLVLLRQSKYSRAEAALSRALQLQAGDAATYKALGAAAWRCSHYEQSLTAYHDAHNLD